MRYEKRDANHGEIADALRAIGVYVVECAQVGRGFPDLVCGWRGLWYLVEIKRDDVPKSASKLTARQQIFHAEAERMGLKVHVVRNVVEALAIFGARRSV